MLRLFPRPASLFAAVLHYRGLLYSRAQYFHYTPVFLAKGKKGKKSAPVEEEIVEIPTIDMEDATKRFSSVLEKFTKSANDMKLGKTNPRIFDKLLVDLGKGEEPVPFNTVAQTTVKGRNFLITLFDPAYGKHVINSILGSGLNMNAQADPANKYSLKVPLPPVSTETKKESAKALKEAYEKFKHGSSKSSSLAAIRNDVKLKFTKTSKKGKTSDAERKALDEFEKLHKLFSDKLTEIMKSAETAIMK